MRALVENSIRRADKIVVNTHKTAEHLRVFLKIVQSKISVVPLGVDLQEFSPLDPVACRYKTRERYRIRGRYILAVGSVNPRKNLTTLLKAYSLLRRSGISDWQLVIVGIKEWGGSEIANATRSLGFSENDVLFLGHVEDSQMPCLYSGADVFVFPSLFEGFGLPLLEAMACGIPVVASDNSSLPDVGGDAALYAPPLSAEAFADAIRRVLEDTSFRAAIVSKGLERVKNFTWQDTARGVLAAVENG